jgi:hypothetical protein
VEVVFAHVVKLSIVARSGISVSAGSRSKVVGPESNMDSSHCRLTMRTRNPRLLIMPRFLRLVLLIETGTERPAVRMGSTPFKIEGGQSLGSYNTVDGDCCLARASDAERQAPRHVRADARSSHQGRFIIDAVS